MSDDVKAGLLTAAMIAGILYIAGSYGLAMYWQATAKQWSE